MEHFGGCVWGLGTEAESKRIVYFLVFLLPSSPARAARTRAPLSCPGLVARAGEQLGVGVQGPGRLFRPPSGKLLHNSFVSPNLFGRPNPVFGHLSGASVQRSNQVWGSGPAGGGGDARRKCKFVRSWASASRSCPKLPHSDPAWRGSQAVLHPQTGDPMYQDRGGPRQGWP